MVRSIYEIVLQAPRGGLVDQHTKSDWHTKSDMTALLRTRRLTRVFCNAKDTMRGCVALRSRRQDLRWLW